MAASVCSIRGSRTSASGSSQGRFGNDRTTLSQGMVHPGLGYALSNTASVWLGHAFIPTMAPFTSNSFKENRIWQQFLWMPQTPLGPLTSRTRFEQRFTGARDVAYRLRQCFRLAYPLDSAPGFMLVGCEESFVNINSTGNHQAGFDQNRVFVGIGYNLDENLRTPSRRIRPAKPKGPARPLLRRRASGTVQGISRQR